MSICEAAGAICRILEELHRGEIARIALPRARREIRRARSVRGEALVVEYEESTSSREHRVQPVGQDAIHVW